jgi:hypothetical protein
MASARRSPCPSTRRVPRDETLGRNARRIAGATRSLSRRPRRLPPAGRSPRGEPPRSPPGAPRTRPGGRAGRPGPRMRSSPASPSAPSVPSSSNPIVRSSPAVGSGSAGHSATEWNPLTAASAGTTPVHGTVGSSPLRIASRGRTSRTCMREVDSTPAYGSGGGTTVGAWLRLELPVPAGTR